VARRLIRKRTPVRAAGPRVLPARRPRRIHHQGPARAAQIDRLEVAALILVVLLAATLRLIGSNWGANHYLHPDERFMTMVVTGIAWPTSLAGYFDSASSPLNPYNAEFGAYVYGTFPLFLAKAIGFLTGHLVYGDAHLPGRWMSALADTGTVVLVWWIARHVFTRRAGLLAAFLLALTPLNIQTAHFFTTDSVAAFLAVAAFAASLQASGRSTWRWHIVGGVCVGLAAASKPNLAITGGFLLVPLLEHVRVRGTESLRLESGWRHARASPLLPVIVAGLVAAVTFRVAQPYAFAGPHPWSLRLDSRWTDTLTYWREVQGGFGDTPPGIQWADRTPLMYMLENLVQWGMGPALGGVALISLTWFGIGMLQGRRWPSWWLLAIVLWTAFHIVFYGIGLVKAQRYLLPAYPFLVVLAAGWLATLPRRMRELGWHPSGIQTSRVQAGLIALVVLGTVVSGLAVTAIYTRPHTRVAASEWIYAHVPPGSVIATEGWDDGLPLWLPDRPADAYRYTQIAGYDLDTEVKLSRLIGQLHHADYIVLSSDRLIGSIPRMPDRYPMMAFYYDALVSEALGFELEASFTSPPSLFGISFDDSDVEESLTVYDHPQVRIFRKSEEWSTHDAWHLLHQALGEGGVPRRVIDPSTENLMLSAAERESVIQSGTWAEIVDASRLSTAGTVLLWYLALQAAALAAVPMLWLLLPSLPDRGYALAKTAGLLGIGWGAWVMASLGLMPFGPASIALVFAAALLVAGTVTLRHGRALMTDLRQRWRWVVGAEALLLTGFGSMLWLRALNPDLWVPGRGGEKPMELAMFIAILRTQWFPPHDPWFAGGVMHYYYLGYVPWAAITRLLAIQPEVAFNLTLVSVFAILVVAVWSAAAALIVPILRLDRPSATESWRPIVLALPAPIVVGVLGNLDFVRRLGRGEWAGDSPPGWAERIGDPGLIAVGVWRALTQSHSLPPDAYWAPSRVIPNTVNEFPYFSFLFGDLHAHVLAMPVVAACLVVAVGIATSPAHGSRGTALLATLGGWRRSLAAALLAGFLTSMLLASNSWDYPPAVLIIVVAAAIRGISGGGTAAPWRLVRDLFVFSLLVVLASRLLVWPFLARFGSLAPQVLPGVEVTALGDYLAIHSVMLFAIAGYMSMAVWRAISRLWIRQRWGKVAASVALFSIVSAFLTAMITGHLVPFLIAGIACVGVGMVRHGRQPAHLLLISVVGVAFGLALAVERFRLGNDIGRMNLVFKLYLHAWQLLAVSAAVSAIVLITEMSRPIPRGGSALLRRVGGGAWLLMLTLLTIGALAYPLLATGPRLNDRFASLAPTLDGLAYMEDATIAESAEGQPPVEVSLASDRKAIHWMRQNIVGTPVILEAQLSAYRWGARISSATGLPTVLGWTWHQVQQRPGHESTVNARVEDIETIYGSPQAFSSVEPLLERYGVQLIVVGELERAIYADIGLAKFEGAAAEGRLTAVYEKDGMTIYAMPGHESVVRPLGSD
jgi:YYY domain-containing protein